MISISVTQKLPKIQIRHKGLYDVESIYKAIRRWFREREYDYNEGKYKDKVGFGGNELEVKMNGELRVNEFVQFNLDVEGKFFGIKEVEKEHMGKKRKISKGQFHLEISGKVTYDYRERFSSKIGEALLNALVSRIFKNYYDVKYTDRLYYEAYNLQTLLKEEAFMETASNAY